MSNKKVELEHKSCMRRYLEYCESISMNKQSVGSRKSAITKFLVYLLSKDIMIRDAEYTDVEEFLECEQDNDTSLATINNYYSYLKGFFSYCKSSGDNTKLDYSKVNPSKVLNKKFELFTEQEIAEIFVIVSRQRIKILRIRDEIMYKLLLYTGCTLGELHSLNVYFSKNDVKDDDNYIVLKEKEIYFRWQNSRKLTLPDCIINRIKEYFEFVRKKMNWDKIPASCYLFMSWYGKKKGAMSKINRGSLQNRMLQIKANSSFKDKKLSIKNVRHTLISNLVNSGERLDVISEIVGLDIASLKFYINDTSTFEAEKEKIMKNHPFKSYFE